MSQNRHSCQWHIHVDLADEAILSITLCIIPFLIKPTYCLLDLILCFLIKATHLFQHCLKKIVLYSRFISYFSIISFLDINSAVYRHIYLFPVNVAISGLHCIKKDYLVLLWITCVNFHHLCVVVSSIVLRDVR